MYLKFFLYSILFIGLIDVLFYLGFVPLLAGNKGKVKKWFKRIYWGFSLFSLAVLCLVVYHYANHLPPPKFVRVYLSGFVFIVLICKLFGIVFFLVPDLVKALIFLINKASRKEIATKENAITRASFLRKTGTVAALLPFVGLNYGMLLGAFDFRLRKQRLVLPNLPGIFNGLKIVQVSDIHTGSFVCVKPLEHAVRMINEQGADIVLFTGDLVNEIAEEAEPFIEVLKNIKAPMGVFSILGNHDYGDYFYREGDLEGRRHNREKMKEIHKKMGWDLMLNEHRIIEKEGHKLGLIGSENWGSSARFQKYGNIDMARQGMEPCAVNMLLTHDPSHWEQEVLPMHPDIDLTLSGHTHGFQMGIEIPGFRWSPSQYLYKQWAGLYEQQGVRIYVNRGLGFIGFPGRLGIPPEITVIELSNSEA